MALLDDTGAQEPCRSHGGDQAPQILHALLDQSVGRELDFLVRCAVVDAQNMSLHVPGQLLPVEHPLCGGAEQTDERQLQRLTVQPQVYRDDGRAAQPIQVRKRGALAPRLRQERRHRVVGYSKHDTIHLQPFSAGQDHRGHALSVVVGCQFQRGHPRRGAQLALVLLKDPAHGRLEQLAQPHGGHAHAAARACAEEGFRQGARQRPRRGALGGLVDDGHGEGFPQHALELRCLPVPAQPGAGGESVELRSRAGTEGAAQCAAYA